MDPIKGTIIKTSELIFFYPLHTITNYQSIHSTKLITSIKNIKGFYKGIKYQLLFLPINRYIDLKILENNDISFKSALLSSTCKILTYPLQTYEIYYQLNNKKPPFNFLLKGYHYFYIYNTISYYIWFNSLKIYSDNINIKNNLIKNAFVGFLSGITVDIIVNPLKVIKLNYQNNTIPKTYYSGIKLRILFSAIQSSYFNILINY